jgi:catalase
MDNDNNAKNLLTTNGSVPVADNQNVIGKLFRLMTPEQKSVLFTNTARSIGGAPKEIQIRHISNCLKAVPAYGCGVAKALGISSDEMPS